jgi:hypothetical protein
VTTEGGEDLMTSSTINVLLGIVSILSALAIALGALAFAVEGFLGRGKLRFLCFPVALALWAYARTTFTSAGQSFARASEPILLRQPADASGLIAALFWTLISALILVAVFRYFRGVYRSLAARA